MTHLVAGEIRQAWRSLTRTPLATAAAVACLSGAIAAATAVFSIVDTVVLHALPFTHAARLVAIWGVNPQRDTVKRGFSWPDVRDAATRVGSVDGVAAIVNAPGGMTLTGQNEPAQIPTRIVSGNFFDVLGVTAMAGRMLTADDDRAGSPPAAVIAHALWVQRFGASASAVGRAVTLDGRAFTVVGIAPRGFAYPPDARMWVTVAHGAPEYVEDRNIGWLEIIGRLKPGGTVDAARAELAGPFDELARRYHPARGREALSVVPLDRELLGDTRPALWALFAAVLVVLAVACANVGGLLLVRGAARARDLAVRAALGAERGHLLRLALAEALLLSMVSGLVGVALARALVAAAAHLAPAGIPRLADVVVDLRVLAFACLTVSFAALVCTMAPALLATRHDPMTLLQSSGRSSTAEGAALGRLLATSELALSLVLIVAAVLVGRTFLNLRRVDVGFNADRLLAFDVPQPTTRYPTATDSVQFADRLLPRLAALPGIRGAAAVLLRPLWGVAGMDWPVVVEGQPPEESAQNPLTNLEAISPGYFETLGIPIVKGRDLRTDDRAGRPGAAIVGQSFARRFWPDGRALGRRIQFPLPGSPYHRQWFTVVGVVADAKYREIRGSRLDLYISAAQCPYPVHQFVVRTDSRPDAIVPAVRTAVQAIDRDLPIDDVVVLGDEVDRLVASPRVVAIVFVGFAAMATTLAALGLGTLVAWQVRQRTREIGIRMALGATASRVVGTQMMDAAGMILAGVAAGLTVAIAVSGLLQSLLYDVPPRDVTTLVGASILAAIVGLVSVYLPAHRASGVDPLVALRHD